MANNYEQIMALVNAGNKMGLSNTITRDNGIPLDLSSVYSSYDAAVVYAATKAIAYHGQPVAVITAEDATLYVITPVSQGTKEIDGTTYNVYLKEVGAKTLGDDASITLSDAGVLSLYGFETAQNATLPQKQPDGTLKWVPIDSIVDGDTNTKSIVVSDNEYIEVTSTHDEDTDTYTYTLSFKIDITNYYTKEEIGDLLAVTLSSAQEYADGKDAAIEAAQAAAQDAADAVQNLATTVEETYAKKENTYTKTDIDDMEFITVADIDEICGNTFDVDSGEVTY